MGGLKRAAARAALIAAALCAVVAVPDAREGPDHTRSWKAAWEARQLQEAEWRRVESLRREYERRRAIAHARMPSQANAAYPTRPPPEAMCPVAASPEARRVFRSELRQRREEAFRQSTGLPLKTGLSVHPVPKRGGTSALSTGPLVMSASSHASPAAVLAASSSTSADDAGHMVPLFPSASNTLGRQGFARVINHGDEAGEVTINAYDDQGTSHGPLTLTIDAGATVHFNSADLENGNAGKGLSGSTGPGEGNWRLELDSELDIEVLSYIRTGDGFLTAMHDTAPERDDGHRVAIFNPGSNTNQRSLLRLVNRQDADASVTIRGTDDKGMSPGDGATVALPARSSATYTAAELESGNAERLTGSIGDGSGKWRLTVRSEQDIVAMSLLSSPTGHLTNLSTAPDNETDGKHSVPLFPSASDANGHQGFLRVVNHGDEAGEVAIAAFDDTDREYESLTLGIGANETKHFNSDDLELGNAGKGLTGSTGAGEGDWRLELTSDLDIEVLAYIRTTDGFLTAIHDPAPRSAKRHRVAVFNPGSNANQMSVLRLVNADEEPAEVTVTGVDDRGESPGDGVAVTVPAGDSASYTAAELESGNGEGLDGSLGDGSGKWRLTVNADRPIVAMSLLSSPTGHLTNLSTAPQRGAGPVETAEEAFEALISPVVQTKCVNCHYEGNTTGNMPVFVRDTDVDHQTTNLKEFEDYLADIEDGANQILNKIQGALDHGGGSQVSAGTPEFAGFEQFLELLGTEVEGFFAVDLFEGVTLESKRRTLWRAAIMFAGRIPTEEEYAEVEDGTEDDLRMAIRRLMEGSGFHEFLLRGANDRLLTDRDDIQGVGVIDPIFAYFVAYNNLNHERLVAEDPNYDQWHREVDHGIRRAPLELIAHVAENELDYRDILRADYIMANPMAAEAYGAPINAFDDPGDPLEFAPSRIESYYRTDGSKKWEYSLDLGTHVSEPGDLWTDYPHAGILNTTVFLKRYPTTATNRNRARSRWTYYHFLGYDIEKSESRTMDPEVLSDTNNPTMHNPACTACHERMDPVAGAFQNYDDIGYYRSSYEGLDSLDETYKDGDALGAFELPGAAPDGGDPTISVTASPKADERLYLTIPEGRWGNVALDRLDVVAVEDGSVVQSIEFEDPSSGHSALVDECGHASGDHWLLFCPTYVPLSVQAGATYELEVHAWAVDEANGTTSLAMSTTLYRKGDHWYRDVRSPGFVREPEFVAEPVPEEEQHASLRWLAERIVEDERFAKAVVKFWWPAIMGSEVAEQPQVAGDVGYDAQKLMAGAHAAEVERLAGGFRRGFGWSGERPYDLKDLLVEMAMSDWFRARRHRRSTPHGGPRCGTRAQSAC